MLTRKQHELLMLIHERLQEEGVPPSFDEMKDALDLKSKSGIHRLITALEERGFIRRLPNRARALEVLRLPEGFGQKAPERQAPSGTGFRPGVIEGGRSMMAPQAEAGSAGSNVTRLEPRGGMAARFRGAGDGQSGRNDGATADHDGAFHGGARHPGVAAGEAVQGIPVMGKIAAGVPIAAIQHPTHSIPVPPDLLGKGEHYALTVEGDSMIEAGILDGDTVIIRNVSSATPGEIVVALVDDAEATLKRFRRQGSNIALEAANPAHPTRVFTPDRVKVQGRLVGLVRRYD